MSDEQEKEESKLPLVHRDDLPYEVVEEIERMAAASELGEGTEGFKVVFAGDHPGSLPEEAKEQLAELEKKIVESFVEGICVDCGKSMPEGAWPPPDEEVGEEGWSLPDGWRWFDTKADDDGVPMFFQCPECDAKEEGDTFVFKPLTEL